MINNFLFGTLVLISWKLAASGDLTGLLTSAPEPHNNLDLKKTTGNMPRWLKGALYRAGPGMFEHGGRSVNNVVDGLAKVHGWRFEGDGSVKYSSVMVPSYIYNKTMEDKYLAPNAVIGDMIPDLTMVEEMEVAFSGFDKRDNANIAIWSLDAGKSIVVTAESPMMQEMSPKSLKYKGPNLSGAVDKLGATQKVLFSATHYAKHESGSSINYVLTMNLLPWEMSEASYEFFEYMPNSEGEVSTRWIGRISRSMTDIRMLHMFGATKNFVVVPLWNYQFFPGSITSFLHGLTHLCESMKFTYDEPLYFYVLSLRTGKQYKFELPPARGGHVMNTFERINPKGEIEVVMDVPTTTDVYEKDLTKNCLFDLFKIPYIKDPEYLYKIIPWNTTLRRYVLNVNTTKYRVEDLPRSWEPLDALIDFPFINPDYWGRDYCYCYFQQWQLRTNNMNLMKYDVCKKTSISWEEENKHVSEPVFVANPKSSSEDDGVVMASVYDSSDGTTELIVWDAKDLKILARFDNMVKVPITIHGWWFDDQKI